MKVNAYKFLYRFSASKLRFTHLEVLRSLTTIESRISSYGLKPQLRARRPVETMIFIEQGFMVARY
uniref:AlNc14C296G10309 protein n=1 Tax=Albugo laibachii Nc14 TaxID=890382 RepID=F0WVH4_9STRA|nr:AlNc14C296G10309 [Albugo laibachii Nc14]|eukprot:CCA25415.1 AlNc14C296G10309 [Albugo laibachii Nc14]